MQNPIPIAEFSNRTQAEMLIQLLESFGIESWISADDLGGVGPAQSFIRGVKVMVYPEDYAKAREIVESTKSS
jgi:hypothetical protein